MEGMKQKAFALNNGEERGMQTKLLFKTLYYPTDTQIYNS